MASEININSLAYCKLFLHAAKYPHCAVNGVLLADKNVLHKQKQVKIVDAVPLFHMTLGLAPMLEVALTQVDQYCKTQSLEIAGYYQANEHFRDQSPNSIAYSVVDRLHDNCKEACLLMIDNEKMLPECEEEVYKIYMNNDGKWKQVQKDCLEKSALADACSLLQQKDYRTLIDFDCHFDDISLDWTNPHINEQLQHSA